MKSFSFLYFKPQVLKKRFSIHTHDKHKRWEGYFLLLMKIRKFGLPRCACASLKKIKKYFQPLLHRLYVSYSCVQQSGFSLCVWNISGWNDVDEGIDDDFEPYVSEDVTVFFRETFFLHISYKLFHWIFDNLFYILHTQAKGLSKFFISCLL